jgi:hypothetical protein
MKGIQHASWVVIRLLAGGTLLLYPPADENCIEDGGSAELSGSPLSAMVECSMKSS